MHPFFILNINKRFMSLSKIFLLRILDLKNIYSANAAFAMAIKIFILFFLFKNINSPFGGKSIRI